MIFAADEEGNGYEEVFFAPTLMLYNATDHDAVSVEEAVEMGYCDKKPAPNAICIN